MIAFISDPFIFVFSNLGDGKNPGPAYFPGVFGAFIAQQRENRSTFLRAP
ncbi:hypothetical protein CSB96_5718 [Pseudomonas aeruginosa]|nr:hypothetical protein CSB96_5718 [Pseudomonas aeruginosa]